MDEEPIQPAAEAPTNDAPNPERGKQFLEEMDASPLVKALKEGKIAAAYIDPGQVGPDGAGIVERVSAAAPKLGLGHVSLPGHFVLFNTKDMDASTVENAAKAGLIDHIATNVTAPLAQAYGDQKLDPSVITAAPAAPAQAPGGLMGQLNAPSPAPAPESAPTPASLQVQRAKDINPGPVKDQANPALGLLNGLQKRAG